MPQDRQWKTLRLGNISCMLHDNYDQPNTQRQKFFQNLSDKEATTAVYAKKGTQGRR